MKPVEARSGSVPVDELTSIVARLDELVSRMTVSLRNDRGEVLRAIDATVEWYDRNLNGRTGMVLTGAQKAELAEIMEREVPGIIAARNADRLVRDLTALEGAIAASGVGVRGERRLGSEIEFLRRDLLRDGYYHREHDDALIRMASVVRTARGPWAEQNLHVLEQYLGRDRWWLR